MLPRGPAGPVGCGWGRSGPPGTSQGRPSASEAPQMAHFAQRVSGSYSCLGPQPAFGRQPELGLLGRRNHSRDSRLWFAPTQKAQLRLAAKSIQRPPGLPGYLGRLGEMGHLRRLGGRWSALGGAWPDPKGPGRCLPTPWVPWVRAVPIGPLRWPGGRSRAPESAVLPSGAMAGTQPVRPCTRTMRPTQVPELPLAGPHAPRGPTRSLGWAGGGCFGLQDAPWA